jgi:hypothetical protein
MNVSYLAKYPVHMKPWCTYNISASNLRSNGYLSHLIVLSGNTLHLTLKLSESLMKTP